MVLEDKNNKSRNDVAIYTISSKNECIKSPKLKWLTKIAFGVGHMYNDLCACMWFTYYLVYFVYVLQFPRHLAGYVLLVGQVADGISTVFLGTLIDRIEIPFIEKRYGKKKSWHLIGSILNFATFPFIFLPWPGNTSDPLKYQLIYYLFLIIVLQFGWACVQVSHLALTPVMTDDIHERSELNTLRNSCQVLANVIVYTVSGIWVQTAKSEREVNRSDGINYGIIFRNIVLFIVGLGAVTTIWFHMGVKERKAAPPAELLLRGTEPQTHWLQKLSFYKVTLAFTSSRLFLNLTQMYVPFYLKDTQKLPNVTLAIVPLIMYLSGFIVSFPANFSNKCLGRPVTGIIGCLIGALGCLWAYFGENHLFKKYLVYVFGAVIGIASSTMQITALTMTSDMIGNRIETGAFVYGILSFADKLANGLVGMGVQMGDPTNINAMISDDYYRDVMTWVCGGSAVMGLLAALTMLPFKKNM